MRWIKYILLAICLGYAGDVSCAVPAWEHLSAYKAPYISEDSDKIEVYVRDGYIYLFTPEATNVKIMSIVGQLIAQGNVQAGTSRYKISARGIYILKIGSFTTRVTV